MEQGMLQHLFRLIARTGDRLIIVDADSHKPYVIMGLEQYEELVGHAQEPKPAMAFIDQATNNVNEDIAAWRATQETDVIVPAEATQSAQIGAVPGFSPEPLQSATPDDDRFYVEPIE